MIWNVGRVFKISVTFFIYLLTVVLEMKYSPFVSLGKIYIAGGFNGQEVLNSAECYDPEQDVWTPITTMTSPRSGIKLVAYCEYLYIIGGFNGNSRLATGQNTAVYI